MAAPAPTRFGLLRHAETEWNKAKRIQGHSDSPLTETGETMAHQWGDKLKSIPVQTIVSSDLGRAQSTARAINRILGVSIEAEIGLREQQWGRWEGMPIADVENQKSFKDQIESGWDFKPPAGENRRTVSQRSHDTLAALAQRRPGETCLVITHEGVIRCLIYRLCGRRFLPSEPKLLKSRHLHWLIYRDGKLEIDELNAVKL